MFGFIRAEDHLTLVKSYLLAILVNERDIETNRHQKSEPVYLVQVWWY